MSTHYSEFYEEAALRNRDPGDEMGDLTPVRARSVDHPRVEEVARQAVDGERGESYGPPQVNHERTAILWTAYLEAKYGTLIGEMPALSTADVCYMNILQKMSRDMHAPKEDNIVDQVGYLINIAKLREYE